MNPRSTGTREGGGWVEGQARPPPEDLHDLHQDQREPERQQQWIVGTPAVKRAHEEALHAQPEDAHHEGGADDGDPETLRETEQEDAEVRPQHVE
jgi:hypothetical protein